MEDLEKFKNSSVKYGSDLEITLKMKGKDNLMDRERVGLLSGYHLLIGPYPLSVSVNLS